MYKPIIYTKGQHDCIRAFDNAYYSIDGFPQITEKEYNDAYDILERNFSSVGALSKDGDFNSITNFMTDRWALEPSRRLFIHSKLCSPNVIDIAVKTITELHGAFVIIIVSFDYSIYIVSGENIIVYCYKTNSKVQNELSMYFKTTIKL